ncbi:hypothetical protein BDN70DRAFT_817749, partial [Pholiota conissans]
PFTNDFPRADIHELLSPDLLHQLIKGTFKDHLVTWVEEYLNHTHGKQKANEILADIDRRIAAAPPFPGLRRFPQGRGFKQWTGDDSKALMKVFLPAIAGHVPAKMVKALQAFLDFCYIARKNIHDETSLHNLKNALDRFHNFRTIFQECGVRPQGFSLPRQHAMVHYFSMIRLFGAPNGLCSSITESKHIKAVKEPWRRSNHFEAIMQMMVTNQRLDKLSAMRVDFVKRGMLEGSTGMSIHVLNAISKLIDTTAVSAAPETINNAEDEDDDSSPVDGPAVLGHVRLARRRANGYPRNLTALGHHLNLPELEALTRHFLYDVLHKDALQRAAAVPLELCPQIEGSIFVYHSAVAVYHAPSDPSGLGGMHKERIRATPRWRGGYPRYDCVFMLNDPSLPGFRGLYAARVKLLFSFKNEGVIYPCTLVEWFSPLGEAPDDETGMWIVEPTLDIHQKQVKSVVHLDSIVRSAHLIGVAGKDYLPHHFHHSDVFNAFVAFYVNKYADHHAFEIAF